MVGYLLTSLLQIYCRAWGWKNFENRLAFRGVTGKNKVAPFFRTPMYNAPAYQIPAKSSSAWLSYWWFNKFVGPVNGDDFVSHNSQS